MLYFAHMDDRRKTIAALTLITGVVILIVVIIGVVISRKQVLSPVPDESAIRVIFISPTPITVASVSATSASTSQRGEPTEVITKKPTPTKKPTVTVAPTKIASPTATPKL